MPFSLNYIPNILLFFYNEAG